MKFILTYSILFIIFYYLIVYLPHKREFTRIVSMISIILKKYDIVSEYHVNSYSYFKCYIKFNIKLNDAKCVMNALLNIELLDELKLELNNYKDLLDFDESDYNLLFNIEI